MRGVLLIGEREVAVRDFPDPEPGPGEVVLEMKASGICGSDLPGYRSPKEKRGDPANLHISGHEPCGVVAAVGDGVTSARVGDRVIQHHYEGCGVCKYCRIGYSQLCVTGHVTYGSSAHGGNAEYLRCGASTLVPLPDELSFEEGAAVACGTGTAYMALKKLDVSGRDTLAIFGQGPVGLSATLLGHAMGARVIAVDFSNERLALARSHGAEETVNPRETDPVRAILDLTHGEGADATLDCTGNAEARAQTVRSARVFGRACFVGEGGTVMLNPSPDIIHRHLTLYGSWTFSTVGLAEAARFIADRHIPLRDLITHTFPLGEAGAAFRLFDAGQSGKCVLTLP